MNISIGNFAHPETHHYGWFAFFMGRKIIELWFGNKYVTISW